MRERVGERERVWKCRRERERESGRGIEGGGKERGSRGPGCNVV